MAKGDPLTVSWTQNRGRDGWSGSPLQIRPDMSAEALNVTLYNGGLGTKRGGSTKITETTLTGHNALLEFIPGDDLTAARLVFVDASATPKFLVTTAGTLNAPTMANMTVADNVVRTPWQVNGVTLNGKLHLAYDSTVNRLHVYDPNTGATIIRRSGLAPFGAAATVANTGAGAYAATIRYYKTRNVEQQSGVVVRRSEANAAVSFTPSGAGTAARITQPTPVGENETHWEIYGSADNVAFYGPIATVAIATTTYDDSSTPSTWASTYDLEPLVGEYTPFPSVKFLGTDGARLYGFGAWETSAGDSVAPKNGRLYFTPAPDSAVEGGADDERINNTSTLSGWIDVARNCGVVDRGVSPRPVNNIIYAFQSKGIYGFVPTESPDDVTPFRRIVVSTEVGAWSQHSIVVAINRSGQERLYFLDERLGPCMVGEGQGAKWCGKDVKDIWDTVNLSAANGYPWGLWWADRNMLWFCVPTGSSGTPNTLLVCDVTEQFVDEAGDIRGGWTVWTGDLAAAMCATLFSNTFADTRSVVRVPYVGLTSGTNLYRYDETVTSDNGVAFQAYVTSPVQLEATHALELQRAYLRANAQTGVTIQQTTVRNTGDETGRTSTVSLTGTGSQTTVLRKFEDAAVQDGDAVQVTLGDASAVASAWSLMGWSGEMRVGGPL